MYDVHYGTCMMSSVDIVMSSFCGVSDALGGVHDATPSLSGGVLCCVFSEGLIVSWRRREAAAVLLLLRLRPTGLLLLAWGPVLLWAVDPPVLLPV